MSRDKLQEIARRWQLDATGLFVGLMLIYILMPIVGSIRIGQVAVELLFHVSMLLSLLLTRSRKRLQRIVFALAVVCFVLGLLVLLDPESVRGSWVFVARYTCAALYLWLVFGILLRDVLSGHVTQGSLIAKALAAYVLLAFAFAELFQLLVVLDPSGSFSTGGADPAHVDLGLLYFSFTTVTTLGYGDILPVSAMARVLATTEAFLGQIFVAVVIGRLVGMQLATRP